MLNGVGGQTIAEAKERISISEFQAWCLYRQKRGSLHWGMRLEMTLAPLVLMVNHAMNGKAELEDFMPHVERKVASLEDMMKMFGGGR